MLPVLTLSKVIGVMQRACQMVRDGQHVRYGVHRGMHAAYLAEFMWRRKYSDSDKFLQFVMNDLNEAFKLKYQSQIQIESHF